MDKCEEPWRFEGFGVIIRQCEYFPYPTFVGQVHCVRNSSGFLVSPEFAERLRKVIEDREG
jgi:hypothetical protein